MLADIREEPPIIIDDCEQIELNDSSNIDLLGSRFKS